MDWPPWQGQEVARLRELYGKPSVLHAAIDDQKDAFNLTESLFPGVPESAVKARADALFEWFMRSERAAKVARREALTHMWETLPGEHEPRDLPAQFDETTKQNPLVLLEGLARRKRALKSDADPSRRAEEERQAREKYAALLSGVITRAKLPVVEYLSGVSDSDAVWGRLFGTRRSRTLRNRYKSWDAYSKWLETTYGKAWPTKLAHILDYAAERYNEGCGKTVLDSFQASLSVLEQAGRVPEAQMLSRDPTWLAQLASMTADLTSQQPPVKQAPMLTVAIILSLELYVLDKESPPYFRGLAWAVLVMVFCCLRVDDLQGVLPATMSLTTLGFRAVLGRTKTTGTDRRNHEVSIFIERSVSLSGSDWLGEGFKLWKVWETPRDFMLPRPTADWSEPTASYAKASEVALYIRELFQKLGTPALKDGKFRLNRQMLLVAEGSHVFFTGHSSRNWLPSVAAALGFSKPDRDFLGRWLIGGAGSAEYTRTSRQIIHKLQVAACKAITCGEGGEYNEDEAIAEMKNFVDERGGSGTLVRRRHSVMKLVEGVRQLGIKWPTLGPFPSGEPNDLVEPVAEAVAEPHRKYFISISRKTGHRRLHLNGPCHVKPYHCTKVTFSDTVTMDELDSVCRDCKHRMRVEQGKSSSLESSSESASSSD